MSKIVTSNLDCFVCGSKGDVPVRFTKPTFKTRALISGECANCKSLNRYSTQFVEGRKMFSQFIEAEMTWRGKELFEERIAKENENVQSQRTENT